MKTKLLYILVSSQADVYTEQAYISVYSARLRNPDARIVLLTDRDTLDGMAGRGDIGKKFLDLFSVINAVDLDPALSPMKRSRILKTGMRGYVEGDFLYIDTDTVVTRALDEADCIPAPLAACPDLHSSFDEHPHRQATINICKRLGFDASGEKWYFNSGVMLVRDTPQNHAFFKAWQQNYLSADVKPDQPSLAKTNASMGHPVALLDGEWNCEVQNGVRYLRDAYVVHYMVTNVGSGPQDRLFLLNDKEVLLRMRQAGGITAEISEVISNPFKGYAPVTQVFAGDDLYLFRTRRYRSLRKRYVRGKWSLCEFLLKVKDHLLCQK
ncbi:MAG: hypothetical protein J5835_04485 [Bacteroidales bacterium]|nr:hypothetical protein [Bacteroidales bacterium]